MRLEIKIPYPSRHYLSVERCLLGIRGLNKLFSNRQVNSIYYDNQTHEIAKDNINGLSKRCKLRLRYYDVNENCFLEIKKKINKFGFKKIIDLKKNINNVDYSNLFLNLSKFNSEILNDDYAKNYILNSFLKPQLCVSYTREYSAFRNIRITHDKCINFRPIEIEKFNTLKLINDDINVLEIKFNNKYLDDAIKFINLTSLKPKRFSKYLRGLSLFNSASYY